MSATRTKITVSSYINFFPKLYDTLCDVDNPQNGRYLVFAFASKNGVRKFACDYYSLADVESDRVLYERTGETLEASPLPECGNDRIVDHLNEQLRDAYEIDVDDLEEPGDCCELKIIRFFKDDARRVCVEYQETTTSFDEDYFRELNLGADGLSGCG